MNNINEDFINYIKNVKIINNYSIYSINDNYLLLSCLYNNNESIIIRLLSLRVAEKNYICLVKF